MPALNLQDLAHQFCQVIGHDAPQLVPDREGVLSFSVQVRGVDLIVRQDPTLDCGHALAYLVFGDVPEDREAQVLRELLHANLAMAGPQAPAFSRNPLTGHILLQHAFALSGVSGAGLWQAIQDLIDTILKWRLDFGLDVSAAPEANAGSLHHLA